MRRTAVPQRQQCRVQYGSQRDRSGDGPGSRTHHGPERARTRHRHTQLLNCTARQLSCLAPAAVVRFAGKFTTVGVPSELLPPT